MSPIFPLKKSTRGMMTALSAILVLAVASVSPDYSFAQQGGKDAGKGGGNAQDAGGGADNADRDRSGGPGKNLGGI